MIKLEQRMQEAGLPSTTLGRLLPFRHIILADSEFEFGGRDGNLPRSVCLVACDIVTKQVWRIKRG